jgi:signal transduction histidine kinase
VLQTLALIQRASDQPRRMVTLARRQERELRTWLYGHAPPDDGERRLAPAVRAVCEEIEAVHGIEVEVVVVGDAPLDADLEALLGAVREACVNVAKHAGVDGADVYVEVDADEVLAFVRDRGRGFDPATVADDRRGIRDSIVGRLERHGGAARLHTAPGAGTEVELVLPRGHGAAAREDAPGRPDVPGRPDAPERPDVPGRDGTSTGPAGAATDASVSRPDA